jgi:pyruvate kinase
MLSAESAAGKYPVEAVQMMSRIVATVERDPDYRMMLDATQPDAQATIADAICASLRRSTEILPVCAAVTYTTSGYTCLRAARERPAVPILCITPSEQTARRMSCVWGAHAVVTRDLAKVSEVVTYASEAAINAGIGKEGDILAITAGMPFATSGTTNFLRIVQIGS